MNKFTEGLLIVAGITAPLSGYLMIRAMTPESLSISNLFLAIGVILTYRVYAKAVNLEETKKESKDRQ